MPPRKKQRVEHTTSSAPDSVSTPPRRTTRAMAKAALVPAVASQADRPPAASHSQLPTASRPQKGSTSRTVGKPRKGHLNTLPEIALEIQLEIYSYLQLKDLLNLSRTCKKFREFFLNRKMNESLWKQARINTDGFPERPPFISEPAFVHLLYSPYCHRCACSNVHSVLWCWFTRYCAKCLREVTVNWAEAEEYARAHGGSALFPHSGPFALLNVVKPSNSYSHKHSRTYNRVHLEHLERLLAEWRNICPTDTPWEKAYKIVDEFEERISAELSSRNAYAKQCKAWFDEQEDKRWAVLNAARTARFDEIVKRLQDSGWDKEITFMGTEGLKEMAAFPVVRQAAKLTPKVWQDVYNRLEGHLNEVRMKRITTERCAVLTSRFDLFDIAIRDHYVRLPRSALMEYRPRSVDLAFIDKCRSVLDVPNEQTVSRADIEAILPDVVVRWEAEQKEKLTELVKSALPGPVPDNVDVLSLAVAIFGCSCIGRDHYWHSTPGKSEPDPPRFPIILGHDCMRDCSYWYESQKQSEYEHIATKRRPLAAPQQPFKIDNIKRTNDVVREACKVIEAIGLDPLRTTIDDLKDCQARLRCLSCPEHKGGYAFTWETAINHACSYVCSFDKHNEWILVEGEQLELTRRLEAEAHDITLTSKAAREHIVWACSLCVDVDEKWPKMQEHYKAMHPDQDAESCLKNGTIYRHPLESCSVQLKPPVQIVATKPEIGPKCRNVHYS
ncbi:hypothetical protein C8Q73DRAFT_695849 [Cubamyces lactineus]|nr:hypothetical protein C8Q73DRAFT_695849 [Cubamyces lactineus]